MAGEFKTGQWVIYRKSKQSSKPGPRANDVRPTNAGDDYCYTVDKYWIVKSIRENGELVLATRRGKQHTVSAADPNLRPARFWERWLFSKRFESVADQAVVEQVETSGMRSAG